METETKFSKKDINVPADVPNNMKRRYIDNFMNITRNSGRLMLFSCDQKVEHLNDDFYGEGIHPDDANPEHLFKVGSNARIGALATQRGLMAKYGSDYRDIQYIVKLNSKTNLVKTEQRDPYNGELTTVEEVIEFQKDSGLKILGVGYTVYLGSEYEVEMLRGASKAVHEAHKNGLITVLWMYPRGKAVKDEKDPHLIAGATGVAASLGSDFTKVNPPKKNGQYSKELLEEAVKSAGRTKVVCAGGSSVDVRAFLERLYGHVQIGISGNATGRNIHQKSFKEAVAMCNAIYAITVENKSVDEAFKIYEEGK
ncbi:MAG: aldolase [Patescibacteria group bacterium]|nr:aldolase [Patescibacteria group bacterium]